jgi:hypothetical protein
LHLSVVEYEKCAKTPRASTNGFNELQLLFANCLVVNKGFILELTKNGKINTVPIITYHDLTYNIQDTINQLPPLPSRCLIKKCNICVITDLKVLLLNQLGFDPTDNVLYLKNFPSSTGATTNATSLGPFATYSIAIAK